MNGLTKYQEQGLLFEKAIHLALNELAIFHIHNPFDNRYASEEGKGCDIEIPYDRVKIGIEAKNNNGNYLMSPYWINRECFGRFTEIHIVKVFLCAFLRLSGKTAARMVNLGYYLIELGFQVTKLNFHYAVNVLIGKLSWISSMISPQITANYIPVSNRERQNGFFFTDNKKVITNSKIYVLIVLLMRKIWKFLVLWCVKSPPLCRSNIIFTNYLSC